MAQQKLADVKTVPTGGTYEHNQTKDRVTAFHVNMGREVRFSPIGAGSGREDRMPVDEFLNTYTEVQEKAPKPTENNADGTEA